MGYRGELVEREEARRLRGLGWTMPAIAAELGVARSTVSRWTRDIAVEVIRRASRRPGPNVLERRKQAEIASCWKRAGPASATSPSASSSSPAPPFTPARQ